MTVDVKHKPLEISHHLKANDWTSMVLTAFFFPFVALKLLATHTVKHNAPTATTAGAELTGKFSGKKKRGHFCAVVS